MFLKNFGVFFEVLSCQRNLFFPTPTPTPTSPEKKQQFFLPHPHNLQLVLLPPKQRLLDQHLVRQGSRDTGRDDLLELVHVVGDATSGTPQSESRPDDQRKFADHLVDCKGLFHRGRGPGGGGVEPDVLHSVLEELAVLGLVDRGELGADELDAVPVFGDDIF